jgi:hypothetical protein
MTAPECGRWRVRALPVLLVGAVLLALPASGALASDPGKERLPKVMHVVQHSTPPEANDAREMVEVAEEFERVLKELEQALKQLERFKHHHHHHHHSGAFDAGVQQVGDYAPDQDGSSPTSDSDAGTPTGMFPGSGGSQSTPPATKGSNTPSTKGATPSKGAFDKYWHLFREFWQAYHHLHHDHDQLSRLGDSHHHQYAYQPLRPGEPSRWTGAAKAHDSDLKTTVNSKSTTPKANTSPTDGHHGLPGAGNVSKSVTGNNSKTNVSTLSAKQPPHHDPVQAAKLPAGQKHTAFAKNYAVAQHVGTHVALHPVVVQHPATPATKRK